MRDRSPIPTGWGSLGLGGACVDNVAAVAARPPGAARCVEKVGQVAKLKGLSLHPPEVGKL
eukprot:6296044-Pyramimonas_sp.AAC.1